MIKKIKAMFIIVCLVLTMVSCQTADILTGATTPDKDWDLITESANGTVVNLYTTDSDESMRAWLSSKFYKTLKEVYDIELNVKILSFEDIMYTLEMDALNETKDGSMDLLIIRDDEFRKLKEKDFLYDQIADKIPNLEENINLLDLDVSTEHGEPLDNFGVAFSREQFVFVFDEDELETYPIDTIELMAFVKENPNTFTYPNPQMDPVGSEFLRTVIFEIVGQENLKRLYTETIDEAELKALIQPALDYLVLLDSYILKDEGSYFKSIDKVNEHFVSGELYFSMTDDFAYTTDAIKGELYPDGGRSFIFENGTLMDTNYLVVPMNASNKTGAIVAINELLSIEMQLDKYIPSNWGSLPILDLNLMSDSDADKFERASVKRNTVRVEELALNRYSELPITVIEMMNTLWDQNVNQ